MYEVNSLILKEFHFASTTSMMIIKLCNNVSCNGTSRGGVNDSSIYLILTPTSCHLFDAQQEISKSPCSFFMEI